MILPWVLSILSTASGPIARGSGPTTRGLVGGCSPALGWLPGALGTLGAFLWLLGRLAIGLMPSLTGAARCWPGKPGKPPNGYHLPLRSEACLPADCWRGRNASWVVDGWIVDVTPAGWLAGCAASVIVVAGAAGRCYAAHSRTDWRLGCVVAAGGFPGGR